MYHLFGKVYLEIDAALDEFKKRVIISRKYGVGFKNGVPAQFTPDLYYGAESCTALIGEGKVFANFVEFIDKISELSSGGDDTFVIYADMAAIMQIYSSWLKLILANPRSSDAYMLFKAHTYQKQLFGNSRRSSWSNQTLDLVDQKSFNVCFENSDKPSIEHKKNYVANNLDKISIEFLLASYLAGNVSFKDALKKRIRLLARKDIEKNLYELKEILLMNLTNNVFLEKIGVSRIYNIANFYRVFDEKGPIFRSFFNHDIWGDGNELRKPSASGSLNLQNITDSDLDNFRSFSKAVVSQWGDATYYDDTSSKTGKLSFIPELCEQELSDECLDKLLAYERDNTTSGGSFYSPEIQTVNHYFMSHVFSCMREDRVMELEPYILAN